MRGMTGRRVPHGRAAAADGGFGLVEVLVALLVVAVGVTGSLRLLVHGLREARAALWRTQAAILAADLADRMRANAAGMGAYDPAGYPGGPAADACDPVAPCTPEALAEADLADWLATVEARLPRCGVPGAQVAAVTIEPDAGAALDRVRIVLRWRDPLAGTPASSSTDLAVARPGAGP